MEQSDNQDKLVSDIKQLVETLDENQDNAGDIFSFLDQVRNEGMTTVVEEEKK